MTGVGSMDDVYKHYLKVIEENKQLEKKLDIAVKALEEIKNVYIDLTTKDEYGSYYIDDAKLFIDIVGKIIKELKENNQCHI